MTEYLYPGVFVEETTAGARPIEGVGTSTAGFLSPLTVALLRAVHAHVPQWTASNESDPGVTLVELAAFLATEALYRAPLSSPAARSAAARAADALGRLAERGTSCEPLTRPHFFSGRLLDAAAFEAEQNYHREKLRRHNRVLHGFGIVGGLEVEVEHVNGEWNIMVMPGYAIAVDGEELALPCGVRMPAPASLAPTFVTLRYGQRAVSPAAVGSAPPGMTMIEEGASIGLHRDVVPPAVALARLIHDDGGWKRDLAFVAPRTR